MNKNFTRVISVVLAVLMLISVVSVMIYAIAAAL